MGDNTHPSFFVVSHTFISVFDAFETIYGEWCGAEGTLSCFWG